MLTALNFLFPFSVSLSHNYCCCCCFVFPRRFPVLRLHEPTAAVCIPGPSLFYSAADTLRERLRLQTSARRPPCWRGLLAKGGSLRGLIRRAAELRTRLMLLSDEAFSQQTPQFAGDIPGFNSFLDRGYQAFIYFHLILPLPPLYCFHVIQNSFLLRWQVTSTASSFRPHGSVMRLCRNREKQVDPRRKGFLDTWRTAPCMCPFLLLPRVVPVTREQKLLRLLKEALK